MSAFMWVAVALVVVLSSARLTRLLVNDKFPPILWVRNKYEDATDGSGWQRLTMCPYCMSFWITLTVVLWGWLTDWQTAWWVVNSIFAASYLAAIVVIYDGDEDED